MAEKPYEVVVAIYGVKQEPVAATLEQVIAWFRRVTPYGTGYQIVSVTLKGETWE